MPVQLSLAVADQTQVGEVRRAAVKAAETAGLSENKRSDAAIIATELATNLSRHATGGRVLVQALQLNDAAMVEMLAVDAGPGIRDIQRSLQDGYSTGGTQGTGFGAIRRLSDEFDVWSNATGTVVLSRVHAAPPRAKHVFAIGAVSLPAPYEHLCGDAWRVQTREQSLSLMIADGLGHGPLASEAAERAADVFSAQAFADAASFYTHTHRALTGSRGAALARAVIDTQGNVEYSGVGNIAGQLVGLEASRGLPSQNGIVGAEMRSRIASQTYVWPAAGVLVMHSDGITSRWSLTNYPGLLQRHPAIVAAVFGRDFVRGKDDATVVVVKRIGSAAA